MTEDSDRQTAAGRARRRNAVARCQVLLLLLMSSMVVFGASARGDSLPATSPDAKSEHRVSSPDARSDREGVEVITVEAKPLSITNDATAFATVIDTEEALAEFKTVAQVLSETAGVYVRRFGGLGDFSTISIRGSSSGQVQIFFDGVPLTRARSDTVNLADLSLGALDRIEIYRGTTPMSVGASAIGGVVNLVTGTPSDEPTASLLVGGGSFGTRQANLTASGRAGSWGILGAVNYLGSEGDFPFDDDNGTPLNPHDDQRSLRQNNAFNSVDLILKGVLDLSPRVQLSALSELYVNEQGVPGIGVFQAEDADLSDLRNLNYLRLAADGLAGVPEEIDATLFFVYEEEQFDDRLGEVGPGRQQTRNRTFSGGGNVHGAQQWGRHLLEARLDLAGEVFVPRDLLTSEEQSSDQSRISFDVGLGDTISLLGDDLLLNGQFRYELAADDFGDIDGSALLLGDQVEGGVRHLVAPRLGVSYAITESLRLKGNVGRSGRFPTFFELFGNRGFVVGNPNLKTETGTNLDIGFEAQHRFFSFLAIEKLEAVFFWRDVDDLIVLEQNSQFRSVHKNLAAAEILGTEIGLQLAAWEDLRLTANYTFQDARDRSGGRGRDGNRIPGVPESQVYARLAFNRFALAPFYELSFASGNFVDSANLREIQARTVHTMGARFAPSGWPFSATFEARNFTDNQIADVAGFPLPGIAFFGTLTYRFDETN